MVLIALIVGVWVGFQWHKQEMANTCREEQSWKDEFKRSGLEKVTSNERQVRQGGGLE
jgi:hypothetical protein